MQLDGFPLLADGSASEVDERNADFGADFAGLSLADFGSGDGRDPERGKNR